MNYFDEQIALLKDERQYDFNYHQNLLLNTTLQERKLLGISWFPVVISSTELGRGDYLTITINKTNSIEDGHKFRFGMPVVLFSNYEPLEDRLEGIISFVSRSEMRISVRVDELPDWCRRGKIGVDLLFDEHSYKEMFTALEDAKVQFLSNDKNNIVRQLLGEERWNCNRDAIDFYKSDSLNLSQTKAISNMLSDSPLTILHGPPGTGKTTTLIEGIRALIKAYKKQILVVAPSNTAVDLLAERLNEVGVSVLRVGNPVRVSDSLQELTLDAKIEQHSANKDRKDLAKQARAYTDMAHKYKRNFGKSERDQRKALFDEARKLRKEVDKIQDYIIQDVVDKVEVIACTLVGANNNYIRDRVYQTVIIDEAAQALEPACWLPILKAQRVIMAGDHCQLPPTIKSNTKIGFNITLFEKLVGKFPDAVSLLDTQYRMHSQIMNYPSKMLYGDKLKADISVSTTTLIDDSQSVVFIDTAGSGFEELIEDNAISNREEALFLRDHLLKLIQSSSEKYDFDNFPSIGIVAPYRQQATLLKELILEDNVLATVSPKIQVHTIDSFQGQEKDIIYISLTRSSSDQQIGFLSDIRRMNVAMTRAKKKLVVIGDSSTIGQNSFYKGFLEYVTSLNNYHSVWEWMD